VSTHVENEENRIAELGAFFTALARKTPVKIPAIDADAILAGSPMPEASLVWTGRCSVHPIEV
jgi:hypothetical protein